MPSISARCTGFFRVCSRLAARAIWNAAVTGNIARLNAIATAARCAHLMTQEGTNSEEECGAHEKRGRKHGQVAEHARHLSSAQREPTAQVSHTLGQFSPAPPAGPGAAPSAHRIVGVLLSLLQHRWRIAVVAETGTATPTAASSALCPIALSASRPARAVRAVRAVRGRRGQRTAAKASGAPPRAPRLVGAAWQYRNGSRHALMGEAGQQRYVPRRPAHSLQVLASVQQRL
jgi:hypothetical protein